MLAGRERCVVHYVKSETFQAGAIVQNIMGAKMLFAYLSVGGDDLD